MNSRTNYFFRKKYIIVIVYSVFVIYSVRLFSVQLFNSKYKKLADNNAFLKKTIQPPRGLVYDRKKNLLIFNQLKSELCIVIKEVNNLDTLLLCKVLNISLNYCRKKLKNIFCEKSKHFSQIFLSQLEDREYYAFKQNEYKFPGFYLQDKIVRKYVYNCASHILGYISEVNKQNIYNDSIYQIGDYIGKTGVECSYEKQLKGEKGFDFFLRNPRYDFEQRCKIYKRNIVPLHGKDITLSIDISLQAYGEELIKNKLGTIIMIEPKTGEILCMLSSPTYDVNFLNGGQELNESISKLAKDPRTPLFNRALNGIYPPGSTFKMAQSLVFLQEGIINQNTEYSCCCGWAPANRHPLCHLHKSPLQLVPAIGMSCNSYFCWGLKNMIENKKYKSFQNAIDRWRYLMLSQGFGVRLGVDLPYERKGFIPSSQYYDKLYKKHWNAFSIIPIAIGQGEIALSPIQMCNLAASIANRGYFYTPHIVKKISNERLNNLYLYPRYTGIKSKYYTPIVEGMRLAVTSGTCSLANISDITVCGKTGTAQNSKKDHSIFIGFAPMNVPKVAILVFIENGGFGSSCAVSIARLMIQKYFKNIIPNSDKLIENSIKKLHIN